MFFNYKSKSKSIEFNVESFLIEFSKFIKLLSLNLLLLYNYLVYQTLSNFKIII